MRYFLLLAFLLTSHTAFSEDKYTHEYSSYLGGNNFEQARDLAVDKDGNIYIAGGTSSPDFPVTQGAYQTQYNDQGSESVGNWGPMMAFVSKFSQNGELIWSTFIGGPNYDRCYAVEVDDDGYVYVGGRAGDDFPTTTGAAQEDFFGDRNWRNNLYGKQNGFVTKLSPDGSEIIWSTYYGDDSWGFFRDIDIDDEGNVYGILNAVRNKPMGIDEDSFDNTHNGGSDMVAVKFSSDGSRVEWATFIGGSDDDQGGPSIRIGPDKSVYVCGGTRSDDLPTTTGAVQENYGGDGDMYIARFSPDGSSLIYCTYFGSTGTEVTETHGLFVDHFGQAYVACGTTSFDIATTPNAHKPTTNTRDCLLFKISTDGTELLACTYFGGSEGEHPEGLYVDKDQNLYFGGETVSSDLPVTPNAPFKNFNGDTDAYVAKLNPDFSELEFCTYYGGNGRESVRAFNVSESGAICTSGQSHSTNLPTTDNAYQKDHIAPENWANVFLSIFEPEEETNVETEKSGFMIYPNPASNQVNIESEMPINSIKLIDLDGNIVAKETGLVTNHNKIDISNLPNGSYTVIVNTVAGMTIQKRIVKTK